MWIMNQLKIAMYFLLNVDIALGMVNGRDFVEGRKIIELWLAGRRLRTCWSSSPPLSSCLWSLGAKVQLGGPWMGKDEGCNKLHKNFAIFGITSTVALPSHFSTQQSRRSNTRLLRASSAHSFTSLAWMHGFKVQCVWVRFSLSDLGFLYTTVEEWGRSKEME